MNQLNQITFSNKDILICCGIGACLLGTYYLAKQLDPQKQKVFLSTIGTVIAIKHKYDVTKKAVETAEKEFTGVFLDA